MNIILLNIDIKEGLSIGISVFALIVSCLSIVINRLNAKKNIQLSIQQALFKSVCEKVKDCNELWAKERDLRRGPNETYYKVISEIIISKQVIEKAFDIFSKNHTTISKFKEDYYYLFWNQLSTSLRQFIATTPQLSKEVGNPVYSNQIEEITTTFKKYL